MQEFSVPAKWTVEPSANVSDAVFDNAKASPSHVALKRNVGGVWQNITSAEFRDDVVAVAKGFIAAGIQPGEPVAIMSRTCYEWTLLDYGLWAAGAIPVPIYDTSSAEQVDWILSNSGCIAAFTELDRHREVVESVKGNITGLRDIWQLSKGDLDSLRKAGESVDAATVEERRRHNNADSTATFIYTSGTTGMPKGCQLTHGNLLAEVSALKAEMPEVFQMQGASTLLFLPLAHVFARAVEVAFISLGLPLAHTNDTKNLLPDLAAFKPSFLVSVPRVFEKVFTGAQTQAHAGGGAKAKIFDMATATAIQFSQAQDTGAKTPMMLKQKHALFDRLVYSKLRAAMGGQVQYCISGGAPLGERLGHFFRGIGVQVLEGYGLTETSAGHTINTPSHTRIGTVGRPLSGFAVRIADDGEILLKGANIFKGYWRNEEATAEALESDGWFHSGDIGEIDNDGYVRITGRKKDLLVTAGGKNIAPAVLEDRMNADPLISLSMVVGDAKPYVATLITIDREFWPTWLKNKGKDPGATVEQLINDPDLQADVQKAVDEANKAVSHAEAIKKFKILPDEWTEDAGQITPTMKLKRNIVMKQYHDTVEALYAK